MQPELTSNDCKSSSHYNILHYFAGEVEISAGKNCPSLRYWIHSGDGIRKEFWENSGNRVNGIGGRRELTFSFIFWLWQRKRRLI